MSDTPSSSVGAAGDSHVDQLYALLGGKPVLLPIPRFPGQENDWKGPRWTGWTEMTYERTRDPATVIKVREPADLSDPLMDGEVVWRSRFYRDELAKGNIGVLLGQPSELVEGGVTYHLCSIDVDDAEAVAAFTALNPRIAFTLQTVGSRGRNFWLWVEGLYPRLHKGVMWLADCDHELKSAPGKVVKKGEPDPDRMFGEWRADGGQTVIYGRHPKGMDYQVVVKNPPARVRFDEIVWPENLFLPWKKEEETAREKELQRIWDELVEEHGLGWSKSEKGKVQVNQPFFAAFYAKKHRIIYTPEEQRFYRYMGDQTGLWSEQTADHIRWEMAADIKAIADNDGVPQLINLRTTQLMNALVGMLRGHIEKWAAFKRATSPKTQRPRALVHLQDGMLDLDESPPVMRPFSADYMSRNQLAVALGEGATCPRFLNELLGPALDPEDIELMQKYAGQILLGVNLAQKFLILTGTAGGGKSTWINVIESIIDEKNVGQLRTEHLHERFELFGMLDKTLLVGVDVPGTFLMSDGAYVIKGLTGGDLMDAEAKTGNRRFQVRGEFNIVITCNSRLKVRLDGDADAWRRRLMIIPYESPKPKHPDPHFVRKLIASEGSGILNWMIEGAIKLIAEIDAGGLVLTAKQKDRVESLLAESDSVRDFARRGCAKAPSDRKVTAESVLQAYIKYCESRGWTPLPGKRVASILPDMLMEVHGATQANDIKGDDGKAKRGYRGVEILALGEPGDVPEGYE